MDIKKVRKILGIDNSWIAKTLGFKSTKSYTNSSAKKRYENLIVEVHKKSIESTECDNCVYEQLLSGDRIIVQYCEHHSKKSLPHQSILVTCGVCGQEVPIVSEIDGLKKEDFIMSCERKDCPNTIE